MATPQITDQASYNAVKNSMPQDQFNNYIIDRMTNPNATGIRNNATTNPSGGLLNPGGSTTASAAGGASPGGPSGPAYVARDATAVNATANTYDPTKVSQSGTSSVQNQLANITASGSALNTLAETGAKKAANSRGLLNSSIAVEAGQEAVLKSALPIAQQDASTSAAADQANAQYINSAGQFNAGAKNTASLNNSQLGTQVNLANSAGSNAAASQGSSQQAQAALADKNNQTNLTIAGNDNATKVLLQSMDAASKVGMANIDADTKVKLANLDAQNKTNLQNMLSTHQQLLQTNISASNIFSQYMTNLANISTSDKLDAAAKQQAADNQLNAMNAQLQAIGQISGLDLSKYFQKADMSQTTPPVTNNPMDFTNRG